MNQPSALTINDPQSPDFAISPPDSAQLIQDGADLSCTGALIDP